MKTEISKFCETCLETLEPLPAALENAAAQLEAGSEKTLLEKPLASLNDVRARLRSLVEKLRSQQAYLLIFGPLKSGKSTLMNAISGAYVSEVTSLPGYPCLVFVRNAAEPHFSVTRYNGRETVFADGAVLRDVIADSHIALADQIRATEGRGDQFDPRTHFTEAIRRVDVKLPVQSLAESSTVLVDTPGLYSRMNFGYDVLTREFRDSAACAVFVVKTDNLFLEQVFAEFNQLLGLFSRIFLVINVDSSKRDLQADGTLRPSAESAHPEQIIEAFKTLSMAGPLRQAYEDKRVRIHAVDLLSAASAFLSKDAENGEHPLSGNGLHNEDHGSTAVRQKAAFEAFVRDLTDYLNSSDYTLEFIRDSLRQGQTLCRETREVFTGDELIALRDKQTQLEDELRELEDKIAACERLLSVNWQATFDKARAENARRGKESTTAKAARLSKEMRESLDRWYETNESLQALPQNHWNPLLTAAGKALAEDTRSRLTALLAPPLGGAEPAALVVNDLHIIGFPLAPIALQAAPKLQQPEIGAAYVTEIQSDGVPVRKAIGDWLLFRKAATVRGRLFGEDLAREITPEEKAKRLPQTSRDALETIIDATISARLPALPDKYSTTLFDSFVANFRQELLSGLNALRAELAEARSARSGPADANRRIFAGQQELLERLTMVAAALGELAGQENVNLEESSAPAQAEREPLAAIAPPEAEPEVVALSA